MHGPQALANTVPPASVKVSKMPSSAIVARICSDPGVILKIDLALSPCFRACLTTDAERDISSYEELVHDPMSPADMSAGHPLRSISSLS